MRKGFLAAALLTVAGVGDAQTVSSEPEPCCPEDYTGLKAFDACKSYINCIDGVVSGGPTVCGPDLLFDESNQLCTWAQDISTCTIEDCGVLNVPSVAPTAMTASQISGAPIATDASTTNSSTASLSPTLELNLSSTSQPTASASEVPTGGPIQCCASNFTGLKAWNDCKEYYTCFEGVLADVPPIACTNGLLFDFEAQACNFADQVSCSIGSCEPTVAPVPTLMHSAIPSLESVQAPTSTPNESNATGASVSPSATPSTMGPSVVGETSQPTGSLAPTIGDPNAVVTSVSEAPTVFNGTQSAMPSDQVEEPPTSSPVAWPTMTPTLPWSTAQPTTTTQEPTFNPTEPFDVDPPTDMTTEEQTSGTRALLGKVWFSLVL